jgi:excisionase family DNA binding protein
MTEEEIEAAEEAALEADREWLYNFQQRQKRLVQEWLEALEQRKRDEAKRQQERKSYPKVEPRMLRTPAAAKYLGLSEWTLRQMVRNGEIPCIRGKYWKFDVQALDAWIKRNQEQVI